MSIDASVACPGTRHACDQGDGLSGYTWTEYDPREGGVQVMNDAPNNVKITTEFLKVPGGAYGGSWAARVKGEPLTPGTYPAYIIIRRPLNDAVQRSAVTYFSHILLWTGGSRRGGDGDGGARERS